jgi:hypothetical protein
VDHDTRRRVAARDQGLARVTSATGWCALAGTVLTVAFGVVFARPGAASVPAATTPNERGAAAGSSGSAPGSPLPSAEATSGPFLQPPAASPQAVAPVSPAQPAPTQTHHHHTAQPTPPPAQVYLPPPTSPPVTTGGS